MTIDTQVLAYLQNVLVELEQEAKGDPPRLGTPPRLFFVEEKEPSDHQFFNTGPTRRRWKVTAEQVVPLASEESLPPKSVSGMYYSIGQADFALINSDGIVRLGWWVGPRFGRGYDFPLEYSADKEPQLGKPNPK